ncbi:transposase [Streptosporangium sp. NPDC003464]
MARSLTTSAGANEGFVAADFKALLHDAHAQLGGPISLVWDSLPEHVSARMREWITAQADWLLVYRLPPYAPDLNPAEGIWSNLRITLLNFAVRGIDELTALIKHRLKRMRYTG